MPNDVVYKTGQIIRYKDDLYDFCAILTKPAQYSGWWIKITKCKDGGLTIRRDYTCSLERHKTTILGDINEKIYTFKAKNSKEITCEVKHVS